MQNKNGRTCRDCTDEGGGVGGGGGGGKVCMCEDACRNKMETCFLEDDSMRSGEKHGNKSKKEKRER